MLWSTAFVAVKVGLAYSKPFSFAGIRFMIAGLFLLPFWRGRVRVRDFTPRSLGILLKVAVLQTFLLYGFFYYAMTMVGGAVASIIIGASPIVSAVVAHFSCHNDKLNRTKIIGMLSAAAGVLLVIAGTKPWVMGGIREVAGIGVLICGSVVSSLANVVVSEDKKNIDPVVLNSTQLFLGGFMLLLLSLPLEGVPKITAQPITYYYALGWLSFLSAAAFSIWFYLLQHDNIKVSELNFWKFLIPVFGATLSWTVLADESPNLPTLFGMALVARAVWKFHHKGTRPKMLTG